MPKQLLIGYEITPWSNDSWMTGSCDKLFPELEDIPKCLVCGYRTDFRYTNPHFKLRKKSLDYSGTYDGVTIVSNKFKVCCENLWYSNLVFVPLQKAPGFFQFYITDSFITYSAHRKEKLCHNCGQYESIIGPTIDLHHISEPLEDGFYQSDLWFASGNEKHPIYLVAPETMTKLKAAGLKGLTTAYSVKRQVNKLR